MCTVCTYEELKNMQNWSMVKGQNSAYVWGRVTPRMAQGKYPVYRLFLEVDDSYMAHSLVVFCNEAVYFWFVHFFCVLILFFSF